VHEAAEAREAACRCCCFCAFRCCRAVEGVVAFFRQAQLGCQDADVVFVVCEALGWEGLLVLRGGVSLGSAKGLYLQALATLSVMLCSSTSSSLIFAVSSPGLLFVPTLIAESCGSGRRSSSLSQFFGAMM
jgi:hypothetical protein